MRRAVTLAILVAALGYFVDFFDLVLFSVVRVESLESIGVAKDRLMESGVLLLDMQMGGMLLGGILWGVLGDKRGRLSVLFGSIFLYSIANLLNAFVHGIESYAALRLIAGIGLAGELGAGITLVSEVMDRESRGYGTAAVAATGVLGAVLAAVVGELFPWRVAYFGGGVLGALLLCFRIGVSESSIFQSSQTEHVERGNFLSLFADRDRACRYVSLILIAVPIWYVSGILLTFSPEIGGAMGMTTAPNAGRALLASYIGVAVGDIASGVLSQRLKSRRRVVCAFLALTAALITAFFLVAPRSLAAFYAVCAALGFGTGYWALFVSMAAEQFGTNIRATATTSAPNFVRGSVVPLTCAFQWGRDRLGTMGSAAAVGAVAVVLAFIALRGLDETYGRDLDFLDR